MAEPETTIVSQTTPSVALPALDVPSLSRQHQQPATPVSRSPLLPLPEGGSPSVPSSRPYTATGPASARTSYTRVDVETTSAFRFGGAQPPESMDEHTDGHEMPTSRDGHPDPSAEAPEEAAARRSSSSAAGAMQPPQVPQIPQTSLTFLLITGRRRTMSFEPETSIGRVKELVWNSWPSEWQDERPPAPSYLRILHLGKMLQDDDTLTRLNFPASLPSAAAQPPIVHISVRSYAPPAEDEGGLKKRRRPVRGEGMGEDEGEGAGCCAACVIC